jgi:hypothetical protein
MFSKDADLFFFPPRTEICAPNSFGVLYLLRRDIDLCMGIHPTTGQPVNYQALWPGAMAILAGVDLLAKFFAGSDDTGKVGERFRLFLDRFFALTSSADRDVIYQLRNSLLHSFGLYSQGAGKVYRFFLTSRRTGSLISHNPPDQYYVDLGVLHHEFEKAVDAYRTALDCDPGLQASFATMFGKYGRVYIG